MTVSSLHLAGDDHIVPARVQIDPAVARPKAGEAKVIAATGIVSVVNYAYTLALIWMLPAGSYAVVGSASALLLICGTISGASIPWVLAREVAQGRDDQQRRRAAVCFCLVATAGQALAVGLATCLVALRYSDSVTLAAIFASVAMIFTAATAVGYLQGLERFGLITGLKVAEVVVKAGLGVGLVALGVGVSGAIVGFAVGAAVVTAAGLAIMAPDLRWVRSSLKDRTLWHDARGLLTIQAGAAVLASLDIVLASLLIAKRTDLATYQAAQILARVPVFVGSSLSIVVFPRLVAKRAAIWKSTRDVITLFVQVCIPITMVTATLPGLVSHHLFPSGYGDVAGILPLAAVGGFGMGMVNLLTTFFQAAGAFHRTTVLMGKGILLQGALIVTGLEVDGIRGLTVGVAIGAAIVAGALFRGAQRTWPGCTAGVGRVAVGSILVAAPLVFLRSRPILWLGWAVIGVGWPALRAVLRFTAKTHASEGGHARPRVLHLAYEDPRVPGAGGGSVRTYEINRRLADEFDITVVCARFPGARARVEDGVRYVHVGLPFGGFTGLLAYFACIPIALWRWDSDLVVEDFSAPFSSVAVPWLTVRPVIGVVQWLFARQKTSQYHLPFHVVERIGLGTHQQLIAVSEDLGDELRRRNPDAEVTVVPNGLNDDAFVHRCLPRRDIAFLGRLEIAQKGLDLLLRAYAQIADQISADLLLGGDGPDEKALQSLVIELGLGERVHFVGRISTEERMDWLASAEMVVMPSRYETFGMVAAEALAVATPVIAFDIPSLRALVTSDTGVVVAQFDVDKLAAAMASLAADPERRAGLGRAGARSVASMRWGLLAKEQAQVYRSAVDGRHKTTESSASNA